MRIGMLGGTFDPIHIGHLAVAEQVRAAVDLQRVLLVPAVQQPLKDRRPLASAAQRLAMVELACRGNPALQACRLELDRPPPSFTVDTLHRLRRDYGPDAELFLIIGADAANDLPRWRDVAGIARLATIVVVSRPAVPFDAAALLPQLPVPAGRLLTCAGPDLAISSTAVRQRMSRGEPLRYLVPDAVLDYLVAQRLLPASTAEAPR
jgi:nicotinate (nicotinamide) nucleotide adenylyltransferase